MSEPLENLLKEFPLPSGWEVPAVFSEEFTYGAVRLKMIGLSSQKEDGRTVFGSAAQEEKIPWVRGYFELLERVSLFEASEQVNGQHSVFDMARKAMGTVSISSLFPGSTQPDLWQYAKSNGVAAHQEWKSACEAAALELVERDRILRSWYGGPAPIRIPFQGPAWVRELEGIYRIETYQLLGRSEEREAVAGVFAFPLSKSVPFAYGFAAQPHAQEAVVRATRECLQRVAFLADEDASALDSGFTPTPDYHQECFLGENGQKKIQNWLHGDHARFGKARLERPQREPMRYVDLTPPGLTGKISVVKALNFSLIPLTFGFFPALIPQDFPKELWIHPIA